MQKGVLMFIEKQVEKNRIILHIFKLKISFRDNFRFYFWQVVGYFLDLYFLLRRLTLNKKYKIIPLGMHCFPRVISTLNKLKPRRIKGEKSCPFDLAFSDIDNVIKLIDTNFDNFYSGLAINAEGHWENSTLKMIFNHDDNLSEEQFKTRYQARIKNLYDYFADENNHKFVLVASLKPILYEQIENLRRVLEKYISKNDFDIIIINQSEKANDYIGANVYIINQNGNINEFNYINHGRGDWLGALERKNEKEALKIYYEVKNSMINIIKASMKNKCSC